MFLWFNPRGDLVTKRDIDPKRSHQHRHRCIRLKGRETTFEMYIHISLYRLQLPFNRLIVFQYVFHPARIVCTTYICPVCYILDNLLYPSKFQIKLIYFKMIVDQIKQENCSIKTFCVENFTFERIEKKYIARNYFTYEYKYCH